MMKCKEVHIKLAKQNFQAQLLENKDFENHLKHCAECRFLVEINTISVKDYLPADIKASVDFYNTLLNKMNKSKHQNSVPKINHHLLPIALAASIALALISGYFIGNTNSFLYPQSNAIENQNYTDDYLTYISNPDFSENYFNLMNDE